MAKLTIALLGSSARILAPFADQGVVSYDASVVAKIRRLIASKKKTMPDLGVTYGRNLYVAIAFDTYKRKTGREYEIKP